MNRREFLAGLRNFCILYGIQNVLTPEVYAQVADPQRFVSFVIKYTGGATNIAGPGAWNTADGVLKPLSNYGDKMAIPQGLHTEFSSPLNSHAAPQVSALSGATTGFETRLGTDYPKGNLINYSAGDGKSIDVLIGEHLMKQHKTPLPYLLMGNNEEGYTASTHRTSSWGNMGALIQAKYSTQEVVSLVSGNLPCQDRDRATYAARLEALYKIKNNHQVFSSQYLIDPDKFEEMFENVSANIARTEKHIFDIDGGLGNACAGPVIVDLYPKSTASRTDFNAKMNIMYDQGVRALKGNVTRVLTYNLILTEAHELSHYTGPGKKIADYHEICRFYQQSIANFMAKLSAAGLLSNTIVYCNAGSCETYSVHNYENVATWVIGAGGPSGVRGSVASRKPMGSLLLELLRKFKVPVPGPSGQLYTEYGGTNHKLGTGKVSSVFLG